MPLSYQFDQHVPSAIRHGLRLRGIDVLTAWEDQADRLEDEILLQRATSLGRILFTMDDDLLVLGHRYQAEGIFFTGVVYTHQQGISISRCINDLELIARVFSADEMANRVEFLPL